MVIPHPPKPHPFESRTASRISTRVGTTLTNASIPTGARTTTGTTLLSDFKAVKMNVSNFARAWHCKGQRSHNHAKEYRESHIENNKGRREKV